MTDDAEQTPPTPTPQLFARGAGATGPRPADPAAPPTSGSETAAEIASRFPSTGDPRVDQALAQLPDPSEHDRASAACTDHATADAAPDGGDNDGGDNDGGDNTVGEGADGGSASDGLGLPDPALLDAHVADVTSVHRQLQQRLSDLSS